MKIFENIFRDIKKGSNIDIYITILAALFLTVIQVFNFASTELLSKLSLGVLALISILLLGNRHKIEVAINMIEYNEQDKIYEHFPLEYPYEIENSREFILIGVHANDFFVKFSSLLEKKMKRGDQMKFVLLDPEGAACQMATLRYPMEMNSAQEKTRILSSLKTLSNLITMDKHACIEVRLIDFLLPYGGCYINPNSLTSKIYTARYTFKIYSESTKPKSIYRHGENWFELYSQEFLKFWAAAKPFDFKKFRRSDKESLNC